MGRPTSTALNDAAYDLFDRWLAHREQQAREAAREAARAAARAAAEPAMDPEPEVLPLFVPRPRRGSR